MLGDRRKIQRKEQEMEQNQGEGPEAPRCGCCRRVPLSYLTLDLDEPVVGWVAFLEAKGIEVASDHLGRPSVARYVLADLLDEQRAREARLAEEAAAKAAALEQPVLAGVPALENAGPYESMMAAGSVSPAEEFGQWAKPRFLQEALEEGARHQTAEREAIRRRKEAL
jgi:hypothetical protein